MGSLGPACRAVSAFWDGLVDDFLGGGHGAPPHLEFWAASYRGKREFAVQCDALPELFLGPLAKPRGVILATNPGGADPGFHGRDGTFADEIRKEYGSYSAWAASWPYFRDPWVGKKGPNRHHRSRIRFLRDWTGEKGLPCSAMVSFELYPWHSRKFDGPKLRVEAAEKFVHEYVWEPVKELCAPVFAFGAPWFRLLQKMSGLDEIVRFGAVGRPYGSSVEDRSVIVLRGGGGITVIAEKHKGGAGPPRSEETVLLREAFDRFCL